MAIFDAQNEAHLALLPVEYRKVTDMPRLLDEAEADVISAFTETGEGLLGVEVAEGVFVQLKGYDPDPALVEATLAKAVRREVAAIAVWRHQRERVNLMVQTDTKGEKSTTLSDRAGQLFPAGFGRWLRPYDLRTKRVIWSV